MSLWRFARRIYARQEVEASCLTLQDQFGLDVNLLLFCLWTGRRFGRLTRRELDAASRAVVAWRGTVIEPLRGLRRRLKSDAMRDPAIAALRQRVLAVELAAERIALARLAATVVEKPRRRAGIDAAAANLAAYLAQAGIPLMGAARRSVEVLRSAAQIPRE